MATIRWKIDADGSWNTASNWNPQRLPDATDAVRIDTTHFHTITVHEDVTVRSLTVGNDELVVTDGAFLTIENGGTFANDLTMLWGQFDVAAETVTVNGLLSLNPGNRVFGGGTLVAAGGAELHGPAIDMEGPGTTVFQGTTKLLDNAALNIFADRVVENQGTISMTERTLITFASAPFNSNQPSGGTFHNVHGAKVIIDFTGQWVAINTNDGKNIHFINDGLLEFIGTGGATSDVYVQNNGAMTVTRGSMAFTAGGFTGADNLRVSAGASLSLGSGSFFSGGDPSLPFTMTGGTTHGAGTIAIVNDMNLTGDTTFSGALHYVFGELSIDTHTVRVKGQLDIEGSTAVAGTGKIVAAGDALVTGGFQTIGAGHTTLSGTTTVSGDGAFIVRDGWVLENKGTLTSTGRTTFFIGKNPFGAQTSSDATVKNDHGASITFNSANDVGAIVAGTTNTAFVNEGYVESIGHGTIDLTVKTLVNKGEIAVKAGEVDITSHMSGDGFVSVASGALFVLDTSVSAGLSKVTIEGPGVTHVLNGVGDSDIRFLEGFRADDRVNGGEGRDVVTLDGDYSAGITFGVSTMRNVEQLTLISGHSYNLVFNESTVAAGQSLLVDGSSLTAGDTLKADGSADTNGAYSFRGGAGADVLTGGAGDDVMTGGLGADTLGGNGGADTFVYNDASESAGVTRDSLRALDAADDHIDLWFAVEGIDAKVSPATVSKASFDGDLSTVLDAAALGAHHAVVVAATGGDLHGHKFLVVDADGVAGYQAGTDLVLDITGVLHFGQLAVSTFV